MGEYNYGPLEHELAGGSFAEEINAEEEYTAAFVATMLLCGCENSHCKVGHALGGCERPATTPVMYGMVCVTCLEYMPAEYRGRD